MKMQIVFKVRGLAAPEEGMFFGKDILMRGVSNTDFSYVFMRGSVESKEKEDEFQRECLSSMINILQTYGLVKNIFAEILSWIVEEISSDELFGNPETIAKLKVVHYYNRKQRLDNVPLLRRTLKRYETTKAVFAKRELLYLRNAIYYYWRSLGDTRLEQQLIDLFISLESLFLIEAQELRLRISLRASSLLSLGQERERYGIFRTVYDLYDKRSGIVHGNETVKLEIQEVSTLRNCVRESINRLAHANMPKQDILRLLDDSFFGKEKDQILAERVLGNKRDSTV